jgi:type IV pilus assembly protein PilM
VKRKTRSEEKSPSAGDGGRSLGSLAKLDVGDLLRAARLPARRSRKARSAGRQVVGVDIEPGYVMAAQVSVNGKVAVERAGGVELSPEVVRDGEVIDVAALSEALKTLFAEHKLDRRVRIGVANQRIVVRMLELPPIENAAELEAAVRFQAQDELPMSLDSAVIDFEPLGIVETPAGPRQRVVLVAARREMIERLVAAATEAGLRLEGIDLSAFALIRALHVPGAADDERVVYLSLGGLANLAVAEGRVCQFTRVLSIGLESIAADVAERLGMSIVDARVALTRVGLEQAPSLPAGEATEHPSTVATLGLETDLEALPELAAQPTSSEPVKADGSESAETAGDGGSDEIADVARTLLAEGARRIGVEVRNTLHYHSMHGGDQAIARVVVAGAMTKIPGFVGALAAELELDVEVGAVAEARPGALAALPAERVAVAAGLAVGEVPA